MRTLFWQINVTLDGYMEGVNHELADTAEFQDPDFDRYASRMLQSIGAIVLGRRTYQLFAQYWPSATGPDADRLNGLPKIVFSRTLTTVDWSNARLAEGTVVEEVARLKQQPGQDIALFGSANLAASLVRANLIDEYRVFVSPVILGRGNPAFASSWDRVRIELMKAEIWSSGMLALFYRGQSSASPPDDHVS